MLCTSSGNIIVAALKYNCILLLKTICMYVSFTVIVTMLYIYIWCIEYIFTFSSFVN